MNGALFDLSWERLRIFGDGPIAQVTLNRPEAYNALNSDVITNHYATSLIDRDQSLLTLKTQGFPEGEKSFFEKLKAQFKGD
jgi:1,4-dihydroxy-2-naphthoyl-CoA synthase